MQILAGTSGFSYDEWKGELYPVDLPASQMLAHYATRLPSVEINNTFYRMPKSAQLVQWAQQTPAGFTFAIKASRRITHIGRLRNVAEPVGYLFEACASLGDKLGPILFQLPPNLKRDDALLADFLALLPPERSAVLEVRNASWLDDAVFSALSKHNVALVTGDPEEGGLETPLVATADFGYLRLRANEYDDASIARWAARIGAERWQRAFAYFKHETFGPRFALRLLELAGKAAG